MSIQGELVYREFVRREEEIVRAPYRPEMEFYSAIRSGDICRVRELCKESLLDKKGLGILSQDPLQNIKYHFVITAAMAARYCIEGGMDMAESYSLSDFYIQKADGCASREEVAELHPVMCEDYTERMYKLRGRKVSSRQIALCLDYIYDHLHTRITVADLAELVGFHPSYLSKLFQKETGSSISRYIRCKKIETAQNMLAYTDYSPAEISSTLAFPSQSYFTEVFRKYTGMTPSKYRAEYSGSMEEIPISAGSND